MQINLATSGSTLLFRDISKVQDELHNIKIQIKAHYSNRISRQPGLTPLETLLARQQQLEERLFVLYDGVFAAQEEHKLESLREEINKNRTVPLIMYPRHLF